MSNDLDTFKNWNLMADKVKEVIDEMESSNVIMEFCKESENDGKDNILLLFLFILL